MHLFALFLAGIALCLGSPLSTATAQTKDLAGFGIILLHGKGGAPGRLIGGLAATLKRNGAAVVMPAMPWRGKKGKPSGYTESYDDAMRQIDATVARLRSQGATKIVVGGQSFGANAALGYAARHGKGLAAVIVLAPGHVPEMAKFRAAVADGVAKAKAMVASGRGDATVMLPDRNQGGKFMVPSKPAAYLSYFDPDGPAVMPRNAAAMPPLPLLWVIGRRDKLFPLGEGYAYARAPKHEKSQYLVVNAGHRDTPEAARAEVVAWLKKL